MKEVFAALFCLLIPALVLIPPLRKGEGRLTVRLGSFRYEWAVFAVLVIGFAARLIALGEYPAGFNQDEASAAYDAYSILKTGYDRNGQFLPVHLIAWGSGQNALYSYLSMPFLAVFGLDVWAFRLPMALVGCLSLFAFWRLLLVMTERKTALAGLALLAVCPWHIMKSRWALESNLFPDLILFASLFLVIGLQRDRLPPFLAGCGMLGLSSYAYGTSYLFLPVFVLPLLVFLIRKQKLSLRRAGAGLGVLLAVAGLYAAAFLVFEAQYLTGYQEKMAAAFEDSFGEAVVYAAGTGADTVYVTDRVNGAYALTLFYTAEDPEVFRETAKITNPGAMFEQVSAFGRYRIATPASLPEGTAAVVRNDAADEPRYDGYEKIRFGRFTVLENLE